MAWEVKQATETVWKEGELEAAREALLEACVKHYERRHLIPYELFPDPDDMAKAWALQELLHTPAFIAELTGQLAATEEERWKQQVREIAETAPQAKDRLKALEMIGEQEGYIKRGTTINNANVTDNRAVVKHIGVPVEVTPENEGEFLARFERQQQGSITDARQSRPS